MSIAPPPIRQTRLSASAVFLAVGVVWALLYAARLLGPLQGVTFAILGAATLVAVIVGIRKYRPQPLWPWIVIFCALVLFLIEGDVRLQLNTLGNLTHSRSLVPDYIAIPGYLLAATGLTRLARGNDPDRGRNFDMILDGLVASLAIFTLAWAFMIDPVLAHGASPLQVRVVLACYPPLSVYLVYIAFRIGFKPGTRTTPASRLLVLTMVLFLIGDTTYMLAELHKITLSSELISLPYLLSFVAFGAVVLHPSMIKLSSSPATRQQEAPTRGRLMLVAATLSLPAIVAVINQQRSVTDRIAIASIVGLLTIAASLRIFRALHASAKAQGELVYQVTHDTLTGLPNRAMVELFINGALQAAEGDNPKVALFFLDIDQFKFVNDTYGHSLGDELLIEVAERLRDTARPKDLVARIGGDEFVIGLKDVRDLTHARQLAERIRVSFHAPFNVRDSETYVFASVGVALAEGSHMTSAETMIRDADNAMYQAKSQGRDAVAVFDASMRERVALRHSMEQELQVALALDELTIEYQPLMDLQSGRVMSLEALLRWTRANGEEVPPTTFIPIAEESGLIIDIGRWVISQACAQVQEWRTTVHGARDLRVAVNVSAAQLRDPDLVPTVRKALREHHLPGSALELELTESLLMDNIPRSVATLGELKQLGVELSIDDFGTGYSSLAYLRRLPVDSVKIDRVFVEGLDRTDSSNATLVAAIIAMSHALGMTTIAEGVENVAQEDRLRELGCNRVQGFYYSVPVGAHQIPSTILRLNGTGGLRLVREDEAAGRSAS